MSEDSGIRELAGRYRLITPLGQRVMRGWDLHLRQVVAVRLFAPQDEPDRFVQRASTLTDLSHPGLVRVLDAGIADGRPFLVQEFIAGTPLRARLSEGPMTAAEVTELGTALGRALAYAHSQGVAHGGVHPGNILLGPSMEPYLTDVGIAETTAFSYVAPEQANGGEPAMASDVYSLGLVLLEALTGRVEYPGDDEITALARVSRAPIVDPGSPHAQALREMLRPDPNDRPDAATCVDLLRGSSAKSRVQTRTVLVAAVAAAVAATGIAIMMTVAKQQPQPLVEPRVAPQQVTVTAEVTATPTAPVAPPITEVMDQSPDAPPSSAVQPPGGTPQPPAYGGPHDQPVLAHPELIAPPVYTQQWFPWYPWEPAHPDNAQVKKPPKKPKKTENSPASPPPPAGGEEEDEDD
ncbi:serine/threonine-protein kinase [Kibdelosporangium persicum]|uniref:non-specific serine/threonine protein kinase n=1 Tax=Kibdelosporangium persicum TaxID=2698649 RepID=A0ABX2EZ14_9PSEU|nr:serine/threonine-protein kinase [Kibdelosporangium persicum]NRN64269.1 Serine/threonine-protein kinase PknB [Kibdelosporangium persicum]